MCRVDSQRLKPVSSRHDSSNGLGFRVYVFSASNKVVADAGIVVSKARRMNGKLPAALTLNPKP